MMACNITSIEYTIQIVTHLFKTEQTFYTFSGFDIPEMTLPLRYVGNMLSFTQKVKEKFSDETK
jgi:hypothetical protein